MLSRVVLAVPQSRIYKTGVSSRRYTALHTTHLSATAPRQVSSMIASAVGGAGSSSRALKWYGHHGISAKKFYQERYPNGIVVL